MKINRIKFAAKSYICDKSRLKFMQLDMVLSIFTSEYQWFAHMAQLKHKAQNIGIISQTIGPWLFFLFVLILMQFYADSKYDNEILNLFKKCILTYCVHSSSAFRGLKVCFMWLMSLPHNL